MAAQRIPDRIILFENKELAASYSGKAHALLETCRQEAARQNLAFFCMASRFSDGTVIVGKKVGDFSIAEIASPFPEKKEEKKKIEPMYPTIIVYVGNEEIGYTVGKFLINGELFQIGKFNTAEEMYSVYVPASESSVYKRRLTVSSADTDRIRFNNRFSYNTAFCSIPSYSKCQTLPLSDTKKCETLTWDSYEFHEFLTQRCETMNSLREWCSYRDADGRGTHFLKQYNWTQVSENIDGFIPGSGAKILVYKDGSIKEEENIFSNTIYTGAMLVHDWWRCSNGWSDNTYWALNLPVAFGHASFLINNTPAGKMQSDNEYSALNYISGFLDGSAKMREDTGEPYLELWDIDVLYSFLDEENFDKIYAFSNPPISSTYAISSLRSPVGFIQRSDGLPNLAAATGSHNIASSTEYTGIRVDLYFSSFMEADYEYLDGEYLPTELFHRMFGAAAIGSTTDSENTKSANGATLFLSMQKFIKEVHEDHVAKGYMPENVRSLRGNIGMYIMDDFKKPGFEAAAKVEIFNLVNQIRMEHGLGRLSPDGDLEYAADIHVYDCAQNDIMDHEGSDGSFVGDRVGQTAYGTRAVYALEIGENVSWGYASAATAVEGWMNSPPHRANILKEDWLDTGISVQISADGKPFYIQVFGLQDR
jgi:uncharacterized protein YkwD